MPSSLRKAVDSNRKTGSNKIVEKGNVEEDNEIALQRAAEKSTKALKNFYQVGYRN